MDRIATITKLFQFGWTLYQTVQEALAGITPQQLELIKKIYAAFHGLSSLNDVSDHLNEPRFCSLPDAMPIGATVCKWPDANITWDVQTQPSQFSKDQYVEAATEAFKRWADVCGIRPQYTPGNPSVRIVLGTRAIDGAMGVLAESELPCGNVRQCRQWYDTGEPWAIFDGPGSRNQIDIVRVMTHELGHALGMNHIGAGNLLAPTYSQTVFKPQAGDVAEMQGRYGPKVTAPTPTPTSPAGANYIIRITDGVLGVDGYRLTKLLEAA